MSSVAELEKRVKELEQKLYNQGWKHRLYKVAKIEEIIGKYVKLGEYNSGLKGKCPFCHKGRTDFVVYEEDQHYYCYGCQQGGDVFTFLMQYHSAPFEEALRIVAEFYGIKDDD